MIKINKTALIVLIILIAITGIVFVPLPQKPFWEVEESIS